MLTEFPTPRDIERWIPSHLDQIVGCSELKAHFRDHIRLDGGGGNTFIDGEPGTGKTATVKAFVRTLMCPHRSNETLRPCGVCTACRNFDVRYRDEGIFALSQERVGCGFEPVNFYPVNCGEVTEENLRGILRNRNDFSGRFLIYLDEVHRLVRRKLEHLLLKPLEELDALWIASSARPGDLDKMFLRRFSAKLSTGLPTQADLAEFLARRCNDWNIAVDSPDTLGLLARRGKLVTAKAIGCVAFAAGKPERALSRDMVRKFRFDCD